MKNKLKIEHFIQEPKPEPELEWISFADQTPPYYQDIYVEDVETINDDEHVFTQHPSCISSRYELWALKEDYDNKVKEWKENQVVFEGWEISGSDRICKYLNFMDYIEVCFSEEIVTIKSFISPLVDNIYLYEGPCDVELFKHLGRVNGFYS